MLTRGTASPPAALLQPLVQALGVTAHKDERHPLLTRKRGGRLEKYSAIPHCVWRRIALLAPGAQRASVPCQRRVAHDVRVDLVQLGTVGGFGVRIQRKARTSAHTSVSTVSKGKTTRPSTTSHARNRVTLASGKRHHQERASRLAPLRQAPTFAGSTGHASRSINDNDNQSVNADCLHAVPRCPTAAGRAHELTSRFAPTRSCTHTAPRRFPHTRTAGTRTLVAWYPCLPEGTGDCCWHGCGTTATATRNTQAVEI